MDGRILPLHPGGCEQYTNPLFAQRILQDNEGWFGPVVIRCPYHVILVFFGPAKSNIIFVSFVTLSGLLQELVSASQKRVVLSALFLDAGDLEQELVSSVLYSLPVGAFQSDLTSEKDIVETHELFFGPWFHNTG
jgi:hypothetical protein